MNVIQTLIKRNYLPPIYTYITGQNKLYSKEIILHNYLHTFEMSTTSHKITKITKRNEKIA